MDTAERIIQLARQLYATSLADLAYPQQAVLAQLVAAEIQAAAVLEIKNILRYKTMS